MISEGLYEIEE